MKISKANLLSVFKHFSSLMGTPKGLELDYAPVYGGYRVVIINANGCEYHPFLNVRLPKKEMYHALRMACASLTFKREEWI